MNNKRALPILFVGVVGVLTFVLPISSRNKQEAGRSGQESETRAALKQDLVAASGEKVLEIINASYQISNEGLDNSSFTVRNVSGRNITAFGVLWTVTFIGGTQDEIEQLIDYRVHRDIVQAKGSRPFTPYEEKFIPRLTKISISEGQEIKNVKVEFSFAEFEDAGGIGIEKSETYKHLLSQREGAEIYKRWVEDGYEDNQRNVSRVVGKLTGDELPGNKELENNMVKQGALIYRRWMRDMLKDKGEVALREHMQRQVLGQR